MAEGTRLLSEYGGKLPSRVRIPPSPLLQARWTFEHLEALGRRSVIAGPGEVVEVAPGVSHSFANAGDEEARLRVEVRPALAMEEMFADVIAMAEAGRMNRRGMPRNLFDLAILARTYDEEAHAPLLSIGVQRLLLAPLVRLGRMRTSVRVGRGHHSACGSGLVLRVS